MDVFDAAAGSSRLRPVANERAARLTPAGMSLLFNLSPNATWITNRDRF